VKSQIPKKSDVKELVTLINKTMDKDYSLKQIKKLTNSYSKIIRDDTGLVGCCMVRKEGRDKIEISFICIDEKYRRKGIAASFVKELKESYPRIRLNVKETNIGAIDFYKAMDFIERGFVKEYYLDKKGAIVMRWQR